MTRRTTLAIAASALVVLLSPWLGELRDWVRAAVPGRLLLVLNGSLAVSAAIALTTVVRRIRDRYAWRYGALALALAIAALWMFTGRSLSAESNAVERFHFLEYGALTWLFYRATPRDDLALLAVPVLACLLVGTADEALQWFVPSRIGEWRDVFLNLVAIATGLLVSLALDPPMRLAPRLSSTGTRRVAWLLAATVVAIAAFLHAAQLGHRVVDPAVGTFVSRLSHDALLAASAERADRWQRSPPALKPPRLSREDHYLFEAARHVQARNTAWPADPVRAWGENAILEKYFGPTLDTPSAVLPRPSRWADAHRADAAARVAGHPPGGFESEVLRDYILVWPPAALWGAVAPLATLLIWAGFWRAPRD